MEKNIKEKIKEKVDIKETCQNPGCTNKAVAYFRGYAYCADCYKMIKMSIPRQCL